MLMERLFNLIPSEIRNMYRISIDTFHRSLYKWLKIVPDKPRTYNYALCMAVERNSIVN